MRLAALALTGALGASAATGGTGTPLPFDIGGPYELTDQYGQTRTEADPDGRAQLLFFGYANCQNICSAALPVMAGVVDTLAAEGIQVTPVMITVAPDQDRVDTMGAPLAAIHPDFIGLTGTDAQLASARDAFSVEVEPLFQDPEYGWIYSHGSFVHLLDAQGDMLTLLPPVLSVGETARILRGYLSAEGS
ncbi:SCO family protein [uncultured Roseobacter sp.]|uniref:SCO family protein n=1 Tax=uncultured Roseobacter sp. TaxID=114847 RepID=UPI00262EE497|nr:SCO family protein [uncultured Roseobacter sp.]